MNHDSVDLRGVPETMLQTLYARAKESRREPHVIDDEKAVEIVSRLDYDFSKADRDAVMGSGVIARTILLDRMVREHLQQHPGAVVVNLACGLDTRCYRMEGLFSRWYNLDLPETIAIRRRFLPEEGTICQIACSATDPAWARQVRQTDEPVLVVIEGLTMYLTQEDVQQIFAILHQRFAHATVFVETMNPWVVGHLTEKSIEGSQAKFRWGIKNGPALEPLIPPFRHRKDVSLVEGMKAFMPIYKLLGKISFVRNISNKILVFEL